MITRRGFLGSILALGVAPAIVRAQSLMPVRVLTPSVLSLPDMDIEALIRADLEEQLRRAIDRTQMLSLVDLALCRPAAYDVPASSVCFVPPSLNPADWYGRHRYTIKTSNDALVGDIVRMNGANYMVVETRWKPS